MAERTFDIDDLDTRLEGYDYTYRLSTAIRVLTQGDIDAEFVFKEFPWGDLTSTVNRDSVRFLRVGQGNREEVVVFSSANEYEHASILSQAIGNGYQLKDAGMIDFVFGVGGELDSINLRGESKSLAPEIKALDQVIPSEARRTASVQAVEGILQRMGKSQLPVTTLSTPEVNARYLGLRGQAGGIGSRRR